MYWQVDSSVRTLGDLSVRLRARGQLWGAHGRYFACSQNYDPYYILYNYKMYMIILRSYLRALSS